METDTFAPTELNQAAQRWRSDLSRLEPFASGQGLSAEAEASTPGENTVYHNLARLERLLEERRSGFDALDFISKLFWGEEGYQLWRSEEFHSNLLGWLLDPRGNHGVGNHFLKGFLERTGSSSELWSADWSGATVHREWPNEVDGVPGFLDILVLDETQGLLCAIENKIFSDEHSRQLTRYRKALANRYAKFHRHHIFLSPSGVLPHLEEERTHWVATDYGTVYQLVRGLVDGEAGSIREDIHDFLTQYATTLRRNIMPDSSAHQVARRLYLENRALFDLILQSRPDYGAELKEILSKAIGEQTDWKPTEEIPNYLGFVPTEWEQLAAQTTSADDRYPLVVFGFYITGGNAYVNLGLNRGHDATIRANVVEAVNRNPEVFNDAGNALQNGWVRFHHTDLILNDADYDDWDKPKLQDKILAWVSDFAENKMPKMSAVIVECLREYRPQ